MAGLLVLSWGYESECGARRRVGSLDGSEVGLTCWNGGRVGVLNGVGLVGVDRGISFVGDWGYGCTCDACAFCRSAIYVIGGWGS
jgi:hypothetical protein